MGNLPSKEPSIETSSQRLQINRLASEDNKPSLTKSLPSPQPKKILPSYNRKSKDTAARSPIIVSPVRHELVLADHVTPLVSLSAASLSNQRRPSSASSSQMNRYSRNSSSAIYSSEEESELSTPVSSHMSFYFDNIKHSEGFVINAVLPMQPPYKTTKKRRDSKEIWVYEYGAEKERDRQTRQHYVLKQVFNGNVHVKLDKPKRILDSACGVGLWALEIAHEYPECQVIGIDVVPPSEKDGWKTENNSIFQYGDILQRNLQFPSNHFDFIYQRDVATVLPFNCWSNLIHEFFRITRPGGQIQLVEYDLLFKNPGPVLTQVNEWYRLAASTIGVNPDYSDYITGYLQDAGFIEISVENFDIPIGEWPSSDRDKQYGYLYKEQMRALFKSMKRWWCTEIKVTQAEYDRVCLEALEEFEEFHSTARWKIFTAKKPCTLQ